MTGMEEVTPWRRKNSEIYFLAWSDDTRTDTHINSKVTHTKGTTKSKIYCMYCAKRRQKDAHKLFSYFPEGNTDDTKQMRNCLTAVGQGIAVENSSETSLSYSIDEVKWMEWMMACENPTINREHRSKKSLMVSQYTYIQLERVGQVVACESRKISECWRMRSPAKRLERKYKLYKCFSRCYCSIIFISFTTFNIAHTTGPAHTHTMVPDPGRDWLYEKKIEIDVQKTKHTELPITQTTRLPWFIRSGGDQ